MTPIKAAEELYPTDVNVFDEDSISTLLYAETIMQRQAFITGANWQAAQTEQPSHISGQGEGKDKHWALAYSEREKELRECLGELVELDRLQWSADEYDRVKYRRTASEIITKAKSLLNS